MMSAFSHDELQNHLNDHEWFIRLANERRENLVESPGLSFFRVYALLLVEGPSEQLLLIEGTNVEPTNLAGSICAERAALVQLPRIGHTHIRHVYVVSDALIPLSPGVLCREFLSSKAELSTPVTMAAADNTQIVTVTIKDLWPFPSVYAGCTRANIREKAQLFASIMSKPGSIVDELSLEQVQSVYNAAIAATERDCADALFPLRLAAAVLFSDGSIETAWQFKGLEYGCSLEPISQLLRSSSNKQTDGINAQLIMEVDEFGVLHAPSAQARALLTEHGFGHVLLAVHNQAGEVQVVTADQLLPSLGYLSHDIFANRPCDTCIHH